MLKGGCSIGKWGGVDILDELIFLGNIGYMFLVGE